MMVVPRCTMSPERKGFPSLTSADSVPLSGWLNVVSHARSNVGGDCCFRVQSQFASLRKSALMWFGGELSGAMSAPL